MNVVAKPRVLKVAVISAYHGETDEAKMANVGRALAIGRQLLGHGILPLIPHVYFTAMLNDSVPEEREYGIRMGTEWLLDADLYLVDSVDGVISEGMKHDIHIAESLVNPARIFTTVEDLFKFIHRGPSTDDTEQTGQQEEASTTDM